MSHYLLLIGSRTWIAFDDKPPVYVFKPVKQ